MGGWAQRHRGFRIAVLSVAMSIGLLVSPFGPGSVAYAAEPGSIVLGVVLRDADGNLPERVRAMAPDGTACGSARVQETEDGVGFYIIRVASGDQKRGCPYDGDPFYLALMESSFYDGVFPSRELHPVLFRAGTFFFFNVIPHNR